MAGQRRTHQPTSENQRTRASTSWLPCSEASEAKSLLHGASLIVSLPSPCYHPAMPTFTKLGHCVYVLFYEKNHAREKGLMESRVSAEKDFLEAEARHTESLIALSRTSQRLRNLGFADDQLKAITENRNTSSLLPLRSPFQGIVVECFAAPGEVVDSRVPQPCGWLQSPGRSSFQGSQKWGSS